MRKEKKFTLGVLLALFLLVMASTTAMAESESNLAPNKWVTVDENNNYSHHKIIIKNDGYITIDVQGLTKGNYHYLDIKKKEEDGDYDVIYGVTLTAGKSSKRLRYAIKKGTYYIESYCDDGSDFKFKYHFKKAVYKKNYCPDEAIKLNQNKEVVEVITARKYYKRWYKITLNKKKDITMWKTGDDYVSMSIYDSDFNLVDIVSDSDDDTKFYSRSKLRKGTYYVCLSPNWLGNNINYVSFKWK